MQDPGTPGWVPPNPDSRDGRPGTDLSIDAFAADGRAAESRRPALGEPAAAYILIPNGELDRFMPDALFRLSACR